jgi:hypothetical protein
VGERDQVGLGVLMVVLLAAVFVFGIGVSIVEVYLARRWIRTASHAFKILYEGKVHQAFTRLFLNASRLITSKSHGVAHGEWALKKMIDVMYAYNIRCCSSRRKVRGLGQLLRRECAQPKVSSILLSWTGEVVNSFTLRLLMPPSFRLARER